VVIFVTGLNANIRTIDGLKEAIQQKQFSTSSKPLQTALRNLDKSSRRKETSNMFHIEDSISYGCSQLYAKVMRSYILFLCCDNMK
jgi:hypothetical protein